METGTLKILLALEPKWTVCVNGQEFLAFNSSEISLDNSTIQFGPYSRKVVDLEWLRPNIVRVYGRAKFKARTDSIILYPGEQLPSPAGLRRRRRASQTEIGRALCSHFGVHKIEREMLHSDRQHGIGGAYPRFLVGGRAVIAVDPDEDAAVVNGVMRAALAWAPLVRRPVTAVVPYGRHQTIVSRLQNMPKARHIVQWLLWDGTAMRPMEESASEPETQVRQFQVPEADAEIARICAMAPHLLQAVPHIASRAVSIRLRGIEIARVSDEGTSYPLGEPLAKVITELENVRRHGSGHPLSRAHQERWLESNLLADLRQLLPSVDTRYIYPQVPSFVGEERNVIDLLTVTDDGRLVVVEIKASPDPDLVFQSLDYWIAVEKHRKAGDFQSKGYFSGCKLLNVPALLVLVAPLLAYHKSLDRMTGLLPAELPLLQIGLNQNWKQRIKVLRRKGLVG